MRKLALWMAVGAMALGMGACSASGAGDSANDSTRLAASAEGADGTGSVSVDGADGAGYHKITAEEAERMMDDGGVTVMDVRTAEEYKEGHVPGAVLAPNESISDQAFELFPDRDAVFLVYCRSGRRSKQASDRLVEMGYRNVYDFGGIVDWAGETEAGAGEPRL